MPWRPALLRGTRVLAKCSADGELDVQGGRVEIRYKPRDGRAYRAAAGNLRVVAGEAVLPEEHCAPAEAAAPRAAAKKKSATKKKAASGASGALPRLEDGALIAYTDGACSGNPGPAGLGVVLEDKHGRRELSEFLGRATNNIAELTAILRAAEAVDDPERDVVIHTDSQYSIGVLTKGWKPKKNQALIAEVKRALARLPRVHFVYVRGHAGVPLNERADALARAAVDERSTRGWRDAAR